MNKALIPAILGLVALFFGIMTFGLINVHPTEVAVEINKVVGKVSPSVKTVGYHVYNRWVTDMVTYKVAARAYPPQTKEDKKGARAYGLDLKTNDGQNVSVDLTIIYALVANDVPALHANIGTNYEDQVLLPQIRSEARLAIGRYSAEEIYKGEVRTEIQDLVRTNLKAAVENHPAIDIHDTLIRNFRFSAAFEKQIEQKKLAAQQVEINKNQALAEEEEAKRKEAVARGEKLMAIQSADGRAKSLKLEADAQRYALEQEAAGQLAVYEAEAEGKRLLAAALDGAGGNNVVALRFADQIPDKLQIWGIPVGQNNTSIMDVSGVFRNMFNPGE